MLSIHAKFYKPFLIVSLTVHLAASAILALRDVRMPDFELPFTSLLTHEALKNITSFTSVDSEDQVTQEDVEPTATSRLFTQGINILSIIVWFGMLLLTFAAGCYLVCCLYQMLTTSGSLICAGKRLLLACIPLLLLLAPRYVLTILPIPYPKLYASIFKLIISGALLIWLDSLTSYVDCCYGSIMMCKKNHP
ncbi:MAG: hypothetical protein H6679_02475 [Epsilonproteobacteria bacterium]|nr:hypothetical protein [Campylobacterota bacterium]